MHTTEYDLGARRWHATGETLPDSVLEEIRGHDAILLGAVGDPGRAERHPRARPAAAAALRARPLRQPAPVAALPGRDQPLDVARVAPGDIDFVVVREGTEGPYVGNGGALRVGTPHEVATEVSVNTAFGVERVVRDAFARAAGRARRHLTLVHKNNVLVHAGHLWRRIVDEVGARVPRRQHRLPARRRGHDLPDHRPGPVRRDRHRQPLRRHHHRPRRGDHRRHRPGGQRQHQPRRGPRRACSSRCTAPRPTSPGRARPTRPRRSCRSRCCSSTSAAPRRPPGSSAAVAADLAERGAAVRTHRRDRRRHRRPPRLTRSAPTCSGSAVGVPRGCSARDPDRG